MTFPTGVSPLDPWRNLKTKGKRKNEMNKLMKMATIVAGVGAMLNFAGCGGDSAKASAMEKVKAIMPFCNWTFVSEKKDGDKSEILLKLTVDGHSEDTKVSCVKKNGKWVVTHLDGKSVD